MSSSSSSHSDGMNPLFIATIILTVLAAVAGAVYMSGAADDVVRSVMERYFKAEAKAEEKLLEKSGETSAEGFLYVPIPIELILSVGACGGKWRWRWDAETMSCRKDRLKKNPVVSSDELNEISGGLGDEAARGFWKGGLADRVGKAFD